MKHLRCIIPIALAVALSGCATDGTVFGGQNMFSKTTPKTNAKFVTREALGDGTPEGTIVIEGRAIELPSQWFEENSQLTLKGTFQDIEKVRGEDNAVEVLGTIELTYTRLTDADTAAQVALARSAEAQANVRALSTVGVQLAALWMGIPPGTGITAGLEDFLTGGGGPADPTEESVDDTPNP